MSQETKWQEVAHYYLLSNIEMRDVGKWKHPTDYFTPTKPSAPRLEGLTYLDRGDIQLMPVLRHLEDITEDEDRECMEVHTRWVEEENWTDKESLKKVIWNLAKENKAFDQYSSHWLFSHGFDVFGLIESGQAVRKEKEL